MAFIVKGQTGEWGDALCWIVGVSPKEETARATVDHLNDVAAQHRVLMPTPRLPEFSLSPEERAEGKQRLFEAGDLAIRDLDFNGVRYEYAEIRSLG